jgi:hypothetical protein
MQRSTLNAQRSTLNIEVGWGMMLNGGLCIYLDVER